MPKKLVNIIILFFVCLHAALFASGDELLVDQKKRLEDIRIEIRRHEQELKSHKKNEVTVLNLIAGLGRDIDVTTSYLRSVNLDINNLERQIAGRDREIARLSAELQKLKELIKKRIVHFYKYKRVRDVELLLSSESFAHLKSWLKYQKVIADNDRRNYEALLKRKQELERHKNLLRSELAEKERKVRERRIQQEQLQISRQKRQNYLADIRQDQRIIRRRLEDIKESEQRILALIAKAEEERLTRSVRNPGSRTRSNPLIRAGSFATKKGKLVWPVKGRIVSRFGRQRHPILRTVTENLGIEIGAKVGDQVVAVSDGQVQMITWQRGRGNIVIVSHNDGYYTVYTHLADIRVDLDAYVEAGQTIGTVGESSSVNGPILHFQIWKNTKNLNPEDWLA